MAFVIFPQIQRGFIRGFEWVEATTESQAHNRMEPCSFMKSPSTPQQLACHFGTLCVDAQLALRAQMCKPLHGWSLTMVNFADAFEDEKRCF